MTDIKSTFSDLLQLLQDKAEQAPENSLERKAKKKACKSGLESARSAASVLDILGWEVTVPKPDWVSSLETSLENSRARVTALEQQVNSLRQELDRLRNLTNEQLINQAVATLTTKIDQSDAKVGQFIRDGYGVVTNQINGTVIPKLNSLESKFTQIMETFIERFKSEILSQIAEFSVPTITVNGERCHDPFDMDRKLRAAFTAGIDPTVLNIVYSRKASGNPILPLKIGPTDMTGVDASLIENTALMFGPPPTSPNYSIAYILRTTYNPAADHGYQILTFEIKPREKDVEISIQFEKPR